METGHEVLCLAHGSCQGSEGHRHPCPQPLSSRPEPTGAAVPRPTAGLKVDLHSSPILLCIYSGPSCGAGTRQARCRWSFGLCWRTASGPASTLPRGEETVPAPVHQVPLCHSDDSLGWTLCGFPTSFVRYGVFIRDMGPRPRRAECSSRLPPEAPGSPPASLRNNGCSFLCTITVFCVVTFISY